MRAGWRGARRPGAAALVLLLAGCTPTTEDPPERPAPRQVPTAEPTSLASYETDGVAVTRGPFCDRVSPTGIEHALGAVAESHEEYGNGDRLRLPDGSRTISHEYGCTWTDADGTTARAWVFVPPVTAGWARELVAEAAQPGRCRRTGSGEFGTPSVAVSCRTEAGAETSWRGLYGDAWLVCSLAGPEPAAALDRRVDEWCVAVLEAARA